MKRIVVAFFLVVYSMFLFALSGDNHGYCEMSVEYQNPNPQVRWICTSCGLRVNRLKSQGRPSPGKCPRKKNGAPHSWVKDA